jgi:hypothetical protein
VAHGLPGGFLWYEFWNRLEVFVAELKVEAQAAALKAAQEVKA